MLQKYPVVLQVSTATSWRGGEQQIAYLLEMLQHKNLTFYILAVKDSAMAKHCKAKHYNLIEQPKKNGFDLGFAKKIAQIVNKYEVNFIHTHDSHGLNFAILASIFYAIKAKIILHRRAFFPVKNTFVKRWKYNYKSIVKIICVSNAVKERIAPVIKDKAKLKTIYSGIDVNRFTNQNKTALHKEFSISKSTRIVGNIAALTYEKDYYTFLDTAKILLEQNLDLVFFIIGEGNLKTELMQYAMDLKIADKVVFTGFRNDINTLIASLDVLLFTSAKEGLGTTILDAFAAEIPVVATNSGGIPELVIHEKTGLLAEPSNAEQLAHFVHKMLENSELKNNLTKEATQHLYQNFVYQQMGEKTIELYQELFN